MTSVEVMVAQRFKMLEKPALLKYEGAGSKSTNGKFQYDFF